MVIVLCVFYFDFVDGYLLCYVCDVILVVMYYVDGQIVLILVGLFGFWFGEFVGLVFGVFGLCGYMEVYGYMLIVMSDKDGFDFEFECWLFEVDVVILQLFWFVYLSVEWIVCVLKLKFVLMVGIGFDYVDLDVVVCVYIIVVEVIGLNSISVVEYVVMMMFVLVCNYLLLYVIVQQGGWNIVDCVVCSYDVEGMYFGMVGVGCIGFVVLCWL